MRDGAESVLQLGTVARSRGVDASVLPGPGVTVLVDEVPVSTEQLREH